jgi:hypothetical protein
LGSFTGTSQVAWPSYLKEALNVQALEYNFRGTVELVTGALLVLTILAVSFI